MLEEIGVENFLVIKNYEGNEFLENLSKRKTKISMDQTKIY